MIPAAASSARRAEDLTHALDESFPTFGGAQQFFREQIYNYAEHKFNAWELRYGEHVGTHVDAPLHFSADGLSVDAVAAASWIAPLCIVDIRGKAAANADAQITPDDIKKWTAAHGGIPDGACVAMNSGWARHASSAKFRNADAEGIMHFPGFHEESALMLLETGAAGLAVDTLSLDYGASADFATHYAWLPQNRWGLECAANLDSLPPSGATIIVGAPKHKGGTGGPARVFALV